MEESGPHTQTPDRSTGSFLTHLSQLDHWTFLLALVLVSANVVVRSWRLSAVAAVLLLVALLYDAYEFVTEDS